MLALSHSRNLREVRILVVAAVVMVVATTAVVGGGICVAVVEVTVDKVEDAAAKGLSDDGTTLATTTDESAMLADEATTAASPPVTDVIQIGLGGIDKPLGVTLAPTKIFGSFLGTTRWLKKEPLRLPLRLDDAIFLWEACWMTRRRTIRLNLSDLYAFLVYVVDDDCRWHVVE